MGLCLPHSDSHSHVAVFVSTKALNGGKKTSRKVASPPAVERSSPERPDLASDLAPCSRHLQCPCLQKRGMLPSGMRSPYPWNLGATHKAISNKGIAIRSKLLVERCLLLEVSLALEALWARLTLPPQLADLARIGLPRPRTCHSRCSPIHPTHLAEWNRRRRSWAPVATVGGGVLLLKRQPFSWPLSVLRLHDQFKQLDERRLRQTREYKRLISTEGPIFGG